MEIGIHSGDFLIAEPFLKDNSFSRSVVLLCESDQSGALGFILNKSLPYQLGDLLSEMNGIKFPVFYGGPVRTDVLHFLHSVPEKISGGIQIADDIYWGGDFDTMLSLIKNKDVNISNLKLLLGQSGWAENQLQSELKENTWLSTSARQEIVFSNHIDSIWKDAIKSMGKKYEEVINYPIDPLLN